MILVGIAFIVFALLVQFTTRSVPLAAGLVGAGLVVLALLLGERGVR